MFLQKSLSVTAAPSWRTPMPVVLIDAVAVLVRPLAWLGRLGTRAVAALVLITLVAGTALVPLTAPVFAYAFFGAVLALSPLALGVKLFLILTGSLCVAALVRWMFGLAAISRHKVPIDGLNILILFVFVSAVMGSVAESFWQSPLMVVGLTLLAFATFFVLLVV